MTCNELQFYQMNMDEWTRWEKLQQTVIGYYKQVVPEEYEELAKRYIVNEPYVHYVGYREPDGYYYIQEGDRGALRMGCQTTDETEMLFYVMENILCDVGRRIELKNRADEQKKWMYYSELKNTRPEHPAWVKNDTCYYHTKYDSRKMWFEYTINGLAKFFKEEQVQPVITEYTAYMNRWFEEAHWAYDCGSRQFVEISDSVPRD